MLIMYLAKIHYTKKLLHCNLEEKKIDFWEALLMVKPRLGGTQAHSRALADSRYI